MTHRQTGLFLLALTWCGIAATLFHRHQVRATHSLEFDAAGAGLFHVIPHLDLKDVPVNEAIERIARAGDVKIEVNWPSLGGIEEASQTPVTLCMDGYSVERVLDVLLDSALTDAAYEARGGTIMLARRGTFAAIVRVYDVRALLPSKYPTKLPPPPVPPANTLFVPTQPPAPPLTPQDALSRVADDLAIARRHDSCPALGGRLIAVGPRYAHRQIARRLPLIQPAFKRLKAWVESYAIGSAQ